MKTMNKMQEQVAEFHKLFKVPIKEQIGLPSKDRLELRAKLIEEEAKETCDALRSGDMIEAIDGVCDVLYVVFGTALELGIDLELFFDEVQRSNMSKLWKKEEVESITEKYNFIPEQVGANEYIVRNLAGKIIKSPSYSAADIDGVLSSLC